MCVTSDLSLVEVVDDFAAEPLFAVPLGLSGIMQELFQRSLVPVQQLPVEQQGERSLCRDRQTDGQTDGDSVRTAGMNMCRYVSFSLAAVPV